MVWVNTSPLVKTYTLEEFWELPEPPDHSKLELIAGVLYMTPRPEYTHDNAVSRLIRLITTYFTVTGDQGSSTFHEPQSGRAATPTSNPTCFMFPQKPSHDLSLTTERPRIWSSK